MKQSKFLSLNMSDLIKGLIMTVGGAVLGFIVDSISEGAARLDWGAIGRGALLAGATYLMKNLFTNNKGEFFQKDSIHP
jgi:hypothetical protein